LDPYEGVEKNGGWRARRIAINLNLDERAGLNGG
jgi:hypothetical protein